MNNIENKKLNKQFTVGVEEIREISLTAEEKVNMLEHILKGSTFVECPIESPYVKYSFVSMFSKRNLFYGSTVLALVVMLSGGAVFASDQSLPGNILYPLKVKVVEPLQGAFIFSHEDKVAYETHLITKRLVEAETLASTDSLDEAKEQEITSLIKNHTKAFTEGVITLRKTNVIDADTEDDIIINFEAHMNAHAQVFDVIYEQQHDPLKIQNIKISQTARDNAVQVRNDLKNEDQKNNVKSKKTKDAIQALIDKTNLDIEAQSTNPSKQKQNIITNTHKTLDHARALLKEVEDEDKKGNSQNAHQKLLDSESAAKSASIFLNLGLSLDGKNK